VIASEFEVPNRLCILPKHLGARAVRVPYLLRTGWLSKNPGNLRATEGIDQIHPFLVSTFNVPQFKEWSIDRVPALPASRSFGLGPWNLFPLGSMF